MAALFSDPTDKAVTSSFFRAGESLAAGGTLSQAALAGLNNPPQPGGGVAEPPIVQPGVRSENIWDDETKHAAYMIGLAVVGFLILSYMVK